MSRKCIVSGTKLQFGNNVSHSNRKTRRKFLPNVREVSVWSEALKRFMRFNVNTKGIRTLDKNGGLDKWLIDSSASKLTPEAKKLKRMVEKASKPA